MIQQPFDVLIVGRGPRGAERGPGARTDAAAGARPRYRRAGPRGVGGGARAPRAGRHPTRRAPPARARAARAVHDGRAPRRGGSIGPPPSRRRLRARPRGRHPGRRPAGRARARHALRPPGSRPRGGPVGDAVFHCPSATAGRCRPPVVYTCGERASPGAALASLSDDIVLLTSAGPALSAEQLEHLDASGIEVRGGEVERVEQDGDGVRIVFRDGPPLARHALFIQPQLSLAERPGSLSFERGHDRQRQRGRRPGRPDRHSPASMPPGMPEQRCSPSLSPPGAAPARPMRSMPSSRSTLLRIEAAGSRPRAWPPRRSPRASAGR